MRFEPIQQVLIGLCISALPAVMLQLNFPLVIHAETITAEERNNTLARQHSNGSSELNSEGIRLYRQKDYDRAIQMFQKAIEAAEPGSLQELAATSNLAMVYEVFRPNDLQAWKAKQKTYALKNKLRGESIPDDYAGETPEIVKENGLKKQLSNAKDSSAIRSAREALLRFYQDQHRYKAAEDTFSAIVGDLNPDDRELYDLHLRWARLAQSEGHPDDAQAHEQIAENLLKQYILTETNVPARISDRQVLLKLYQDHHYYQQSKDAFEALLADLNKEDIRLPEFHRQWANFARSEGHEDDAQEHDKIASDLDRDLPIWRKKEEERQRKIAMAEKERKHKIAMAEKARQRRIQRELQRQEEKRRKEEEEARKIEEANRAKEEEQRLAQEEQRKQKEEEERQEAERKLKEPPKLNGAYFIGIGGGSLKFIDNNNVDIGTAFQKTERTGQYSHTDFGDVPAILAGTYSLTGEAPNWKIRISSMLKGSSRIDIYSLGPGKDGKINLFGGADPLPTVLEGTLGK